MNRLNIIYVTLGIVLIISVIVLTVVIVRFFEHYRKTLKQADLTIRVAEASFFELDQMIALFTTKVNDAEEFFSQLNVTGKNLELMNDKFSNMMKVADKYPKGLFTSLFMLNKIDAVKELPKLFNILNYDEELNSMLKDFIKGAIVGGLTVAFLTPKTGEEMRKVAADKLDELAEKAKNIKVEDVRDSIFNKIEELRDFIKTSSKEEIMTKIFDEIRYLYEKIIQFLPLKNEMTTEIIEKQ